MTCRSPGHFGLRTATTLVGWFPAYDTEFARYSPGIVHHLHMAEHAAASGLLMVDMGKGGREYKELAQERRRCSSPRAGSPGRSGGGRGALDGPDSVEQGPNNRGGSTISLPGWPTAY